MLSYNNIGFLQNFYKVVAHPLQYRYDHTGYFTKQYCNVIRELFESVNIYYLQLMYGQLEEADPLIEDLCRDKVGPVPFPFSILLHYISIPPGPLAA